MAEKNPVSLIPHTLTEAMELAKLLSTSSLVPKQYLNKPGDIVAAIQFGAEVGLAPMQALQGIAVINGRPSLWGDALMGLVQRSGLLIHHKEWFESDGTAVCEVQRKGEKNVHTIKFTPAMAQKAGLVRKPGPWQEYPNRMMMWRARGFAFRDKFADILKGLIMAEEAIDITPETPKEVAPDHRLETSLDAVADNIAANEPPTNGRQHEPDPDPLLDEQQQRELAEVITALGWQERQVNSVIKRFGKIDGGAAAVRQSQYDGLIQALQQAAVENS
jgi:hypothetical protein